MKNHRSYFCSTIGRKQLVGLTGLLLFGFVASHVLGNMLILVGPEAYNKYSHALISNPLIYLAEAGLVFLFLCHLLIAMLQTWFNKAARPVKYAVSAAGFKSVDPVAKSMWIQGSLILAFLIFHLISFKFGTHYSISYGGVEMRDIHRLVIERFSDPLYILIYIIMMGVVGLHLSHGISSSLQTLGFHHPHHSVKVKLAGRVVGLLIALGFISQPLYAFFIYKG